MRIKLFGLAMLLLAVSTPAKPPKVTIRIAGACEPAVLADLIRQTKNVSDATVFWVCREQLWNTLAQKQGFSPSVPAVSNWKRGEIFLKAVTFENDISMLKAALTHEFEHLRCRCSQGEH